MDDKGTGGRGGGVGTTFDELMASRDPAVAIVTAAAHGERAGCLIGFWSQCSIDPPRLAIWLSKANHTYRVALTAKNLALHLLTPDDHEMARLFGGETGDTIDKFARCSHEDGPGGVPLLVDLPNRVIGRRVALLDEGSDHVCITIDPIRADGGLTDTLHISDVEDITPGHPAEDIAPDEA